MKLFAALLAAVLLLAGCGGSSEDQEAAATTAAPTPVPTQTSAVPETDGVSVDIVIKDGKVTPQGARVEVKVGQTITLDVTSDAEEEIHVHSDPEHTYEVAAGDQKDFTFTVDTPGQVAVEAHHLDVTIVQLVVRP